MLAECAEPLDAAGIAAAGGAGGKTKGVGLPMVNLNTVCSDAVPKRGTNFGKEGTLIQVLLVL